LKSYIMKIIIEDTYEQMSDRAAEMVAGLMQSKERPLLCAASGDTPAGLYKSLVDLIRKKRMDYQSWNFVGLDEWMGMNGQDQGSCRYYLDQQLFKPLGIEDNRIIFFDGRATDPLVECEKVERFIESREGIDVAVLGLGMNGHIGMNEPGTAPDSRSHIASLDPITQEVGQKYFSTEQKLSEGLTLGLGTLLDARSIFLLVSGAHKAEIAAKVLEGPITEELPGTLLKDHPGLKVFMDKAAASQLNHLKSA
jgi:glucosamine-6-phosphate isomerase